MDHYHNFGNTMAARLFGSEYQPKDTANGQLDSHSDRNRRYPHHIAPSWDDVDFCASAIRPSPSRLVDSFITSATHFFRKNARTGTTEFEEMKKAQFRIAGKQREKIV